MLTKRWLAATLAACAFSPAVAVPSAHSLIDLSSWKVSVVDTDTSDSIDASFTQAFQSSWASIPSCSDAGAACGPSSGYASTNDAGTWINASAWVPGADGTWWGNATAGPGGLQSTLAGLGATGAVGVNAFESFGLAFQGAGRVTVTADYTLSAGGLDGLTWRETLAWAGLIVFPGNGTMSQVEEIAVAPGAGNTSRSGTLSLSFDFTDGQGVGLLAHTHAHTFAPAIAAPVPEPATWALMLGGVGLVAGVSRRRANRRT